jgi:O-antigen/teichoic acid export membrane protein
MIELLGTTAPNTAVREQVTRKDASASNRLDATAACLVVLLLPIGRLTFRGHANVDLGFAVAVLLLPVSFRSAARYGITKAWLIFTIVGFVSIPFVDGYASSRGYISGVDGIQRQSLIFLYLDAVVGLITLLWAVKVIGRRSVSLFAAGALINAALTPALSHGDPWKYAFSWPTTVLLLNLANRKRGWLAVALLSLILADTADGYRSGLGFILVVVGLICVRYEAGRGASERKRPIRSGLLLASVLAAMYVVGSYAATSGLLGRAVQAKSVGQAHASGGIIFGGRFEWTAAIALIEHAPGGLGPGAVPSTGIIQVGENGIVRAGHSINSHYVTQYLFGNHVELASLFGDFWVDSGLIGLLGAICLLIWLCRSVMSLDVMGTDTGPLLAFLGIASLWDVLFGTLGSNMTQVAVSVAVLATVRTAAPPRDGAKVGPSSRSAAQLGHVGRRRQLVSSSAAWSSSAVARTRPTRSVLSGPARSTGSLARSSTWSLAGQLSVAIATLLATPFTIRELGARGYGIWSLLGVVATYIALADLGMAQSSTRFAAAAVASGDLEEERVVVWSSLAITMFLTAIVSGVAALSAPYLATHFIDPGGSDRTVVIAIYILNSSLLLRSFAGTVNTPQLARLQWGRYTIATSGPLVLQVAISPILLAIFGGGVETMCWTMFASAGLGAVANAKLALSIRPDLLRPVVRARVAKQLARMGSSLALSGLAAIPLMTAERFLLARYQSTAVVAEYAIAATLGAFVAILPTAVAQPLLPAMARAAGENDEGRLRLLYRGAVWMLLVYLSPLILVMGFVGAPFMALWAGRLYGQKSGGAFDIILVGVWINSLAFVPYTRLVATTRTNWIARIHVLELVPYVVVAMFTTRHFGILGAAEVWTARVTIDGIVFFLVAERMAIRMSRVWWRRVFLLILFLMSLAFLFVGLARLTENLWIRGLIGAVAIGTYLPVSYVYLLSDDQRSLALRAFARRRGGSRFQSDAPGDSV